MGVDFLVLIAAIIVMFVPTMVAFHRNLKRRWACFWVNLLLGWTVIIWIPLWIWSMLTSAVE